MRSMKWMCALLMFDFTVRGGDDFYRPFLMVNIIQNCVFNFGNISIQNLLAQR